jgi:hypothetical protein
VCAVPDYSKFKPPRVLVPQPSEAQRRVLRKLGEEQSRLAAKQVPATPTPPPTPPPAPTATARQLTVKQAQALHLARELFPNLKWDGKEWVGPSTAEIWRQVCKLWEERGLKGNPPSFHTMHRALGREL